MQSKWILTLAALLTVVMLSTVAQAQVKTLDQAGTPSEPEKAEEAKPEEPKAEEPTEAVKTLGDQQAEQADAQVKTIEEATADKAEEPAPTPEVAVQAEAEPSGIDAHELTLTVAPHVGVVAPQLFSELGSWPVFGLEIGYILPFDAGSMIRPLTVAFDIMYTAPSASGSGSDPNLGDAGGSFEWTLDQQMLVLELTGLWRFMPPGAPFSAYAQIGPRVYLMNAVMTASGNGGEDFGQNEETNTEYGFVVGGGVEWTLGPGALFGALEVGYSALDQRLTGDANTGAATVDLGYRFMF